jgi:tetratricopeptide (TPR) repeat protein
MKRLSFLLAMIIICNVAVGQRFNRNNAFNALRSGQLDKAKEYIDLTIEHQQTKEDARSWFYRGNIYLSIYMSENPDYKALDKNALNISLDSYLKAQELDTRKEYAMDILTNLLTISELFYNKAVNDYNEGDFMSAMNAFISTVDVTKVLGSLDTMAMYNVGLTAEVAGDYAVAKDYYDRLMKMEFNSPEIFASLGRIYMAEGDTTTALDYILRGRKLFADDFTLLINEINIYLLSGNVEKAVGQLEEAVKRDATNPTIFFAVGVAYDQMKNQRPEEADQFFKKAENAYKNAIELDSEYFDAIYNLGALYVNAAAILIEEANQLPLTKQKEYDALIDNANKHLRSSLPYLEKAHQIQANDLSTMVSLKEIYTRLNMMDELKVIDQRIKEHQGN